MQNKKNQNFINVAKKRAGIIYHKREKGCELA